MANFEPPYETYVDQLIEYKEKVIRLLGKCPEIVALILDDPDIDMESDEAASVYEKHFWDYQYVDETVQEAGAHIMVEASRTGDNNSTIQDFSIFVEVVVSKEYVGLDHSKFIGMNGNRLDNLARFIDLCLNGSRDFGIGELKPKDIRPVSTPKMFRGVMLTYNPVDFGRKLSRAKRSNDK